MKERTLRNLNIILSVIFGFLFVLLLSCCVILFFIHTSHKTEKEEYYTSNDYRMTILDPSSGKSVSQGRVTLPTQLGDEEVVTYQDSEGRQVLISNFESVEYICEIRCVCTITDGEEDTFFTTRREMTQARAITLLASFMIITLWRGFYKKKEREDRIKEIWGEDYCSSNAPKDQCDDINPETGECLPFDPLKEYRKQIEEKVPALCDIRVRCKPIKRYLTLQSDDVLYQQMNEKCSTLTWEYKKEFRNINYHIIYVGNGAYDYSFLVEELKNEYDRVARPEKSYGCNSDSDCQNAELSYDCRNTALEVHHSGSFKPVE